MDTAKEVDSTEVDENGHYPKSFKVIYSTTAYPVTNPQQIGKLKEVEFSSFEAAKSAPFSVGDKYIFAFIHVVGGCFTRSIDSVEWTFQKY